MTNEKQTQIKQQIAQIIERSRHREEMFLIDSKSAANHILEYLKQEKLLSYLTEEMLANSMN